MLTKNMHAGRYGFKIVRRLNDRAVKDSASRQGGQKNRHIADLNIGDILICIQPEFANQEPGHRIGNRAEARDAEPLSLEIGDGANLGPNHQPI